MINVTVGNKQNQWSTWLTC